MRAPVPFTRGADVIYRFHGLELDTDLYELRAAGEVRATEPQVFDLLAYLVAHRDRIVTKEELFGAIWSDRFVSEATLSSRLKTARKAVDDSGDTQAVIRTIRGRGYRFVAPVEVAETSQRAPADRADTRAFGREAEVARLDALFEVARAGRRQAVFVSADAGLGKTTLVESFLDTLRSGAHGDTRIAVGHCLEHQGESEAYMPVLEALGRLCRGSDGDAIVDVLDRCAPSWLLQMPACTDEAQVEVLRARTAQGGPQRMLREMMEAVEQLTAEIPLVLVLEDLHWSDLSTIDLLHGLAQGQALARLLVVGTFRVTDAERQNNPLVRVVRDLTLRRGAVEIPLALLSEAAAAAIVHHHLDGNAAPVGLAHTLWKRTSGNPLFLVALLGTWLNSAVLDRVDGSWKLARPLDELAEEIPQTLAELIDQQMAGLTAEEQRLLAAASVAGPEFCCALLADVLEQPEVDVELWCEALARHGGFLREAGLAEWPDGTISAQFAFVHDLFVQALYEGVPTGRRVRLHRRIGARLETAFTDRPRARAAELALHFQRGRQVDQAVTWIRLATEQVLERSAYREALSYLSRGLVLAEQLPEPRRDRQELGLRVLLGAALTATEGYAFPEVERTYERARDLAERLDDQAGLAGVLYGLWRSRLFRAKYAEAETLGRRLLALAERSGDDDLLATADRAVAGALFYMGELGECEGHLRRVVRATTSRGTPVYEVQDTRVTCQAYLAWSRWLRGHPREARATMDAGVRDATRMAHPFTQSLALTFSAGLFQFEGRVEDVARTAEQGFALATERGLAIWIGATSMLRGWALARQGQAGRGIALIEDGLDRWRASGSRLNQTWWTSLLADAQMQAGDHEAALRTLDEAERMAHETRERFWAPELARARGQILLATHPDGAAGWFEEAARRARSIGAPMLLLRALKDLSDARAAQGRASELGSEIETLVAELAQAEPGPLEEARSLLSAVGARS